MNCHAKFKVNVQVMAKVKVQVNVIVNGQVKAKVEVQDKVKAWITSLRFRLSFRLTWLRLSVRLG